jgi:hypothetical protein
MEYLTSLTIPPSRWRFFHSGPCPATSATLPLEVAQPSAAYGMQGVPSGMQMQQMQQTMQQVPGFMGRLASWNSC